MTPPPEEPYRLARLRAPLQWLLLLTLTVVLVTVLELLRVPAAFLIGPMVAAVICGVNSASIRIPRTPYVASQGIVGCLIAASIEPSMLSAFFARWPLFVGVVVATLLASGVLGAMVSRWGSLGGTTAVWGSAPGAASAMVVMAGAFGADARLVAFMQYLRVILVSLAAAILARMLVDPSAVAPAPAEWFPVLIWPDFPATVAVALIGAFAGLLSGISGATVLAPIVLGMTVHLVGLVDFQLPEWLLAASYAAIGWTIGLLFTRTILKHALKALPQIALSIIALMVFCAAIGLALVPAAGIDPLTAILATSPGGMDTVAIIAAASKTVDLSFVMALQMARFLIVLIAGPFLARFIADRMTRHS